MKKHVFLIILILAGIFVTPCIASADGIYIHLPLPENKINSPIVNDILQCTYGDKYTFVEGNSHEYGDDITVLQVIHRLKTEGVPDIYKAEPDIYLIDCDHISNGDGNIYVGTTRGNTIILCTQDQEFQNTLVHEIGHLLAWNSLHAIDKDGRESFLYQKGYQYAYQRGYLAKYEREKINRPQYLRYQDELEILSPDNQHKLAHGDKIAEWWAYDFAYIYGFPDQPGYGWDSISTAPKPDTTTKALFNHLLHDPLNSQKGGGTK